MPAGMCPRQKAIGVPTMMWSMRRSRARQAWAIPNGPAPTIRNVVWMSMRLVPTRRAPRRVCRWIAPPSRDSGAGEAGERCSRTLLGHVAADHRVDVAVGDEPESKRAGGVERAGPAAHDLRYPFVDVAAHARAGRGAAETLEAVEHLTRRHREPRKVQRAATAKCRRGHSRGLDQIRGNGCRR